MIQLKPKLIQFSESANRTVAKVSSIEIGYYKWNMYSHMDTANKAQWLVYVSLPGVQLIAHPASDEGGARATIEQAWKQFFDLITEMRDDEVIGERVQDKGMIDELPDHDSEIYKL